MAGEAVKIQTLICLECRCPCCAEADLHPTFRRPQTPLRRRRRVVVVSTYLLTERDGGGGVSGEETVLRWRLPKKERLSCPPPSLAISQLLSPSAPYFFFSIRIFRTLCVSHLTCWRVASSGNKLSSPGTALAKHFPSLHLPSRLPTIVDL